MNYLRSNNIEEVKYGILSLDQYIKLKKNFRNDFTFNFLIDLINTIETNINDFKIVNTGLSIFINLTYYEQTISSLFTLITQSMFLKIYDKIIKLNDIYLLNNIIILMCNICCVYNEFKINLLLNIFFQNLLNSIIIETNSYNLSKEKEKFYLELYKNITSFLCILIDINEIIKVDDVQNLKLNETKLSIFKILLKFTITEDIEIYYNSLFGIKILLDESENLKNFETILKESKLLNIIIFDQKYIKNSELVARESNRVIGNYLYSTSINDNNIFKKIIELEEYLLLALITKESKKECFWVLSNVLDRDPEKINNFLGYNNKIIDYSIKLINEENENNLILEIFYFFANLINFSNSNDFCQLINKGIFDIMIYNIEKYNNDNSILLIIFESIYKILQRGESLKEQFPNKENILLNIFNKKNGKDLIEKYLYSGSNKIENLCELIYNTYYN